MRIATITTSGRVVWGVVADTSDPAGTVAVHDLTATYPSPEALVAAVVAEPDRVAAAAASAPPVTADQVLAPIPAPRRIVCVGVNYADHAAETGRPTAPQPHPTLFVRFASSLVGPDAPVVVPAASEQLDYEGELAVVIGRRVRAVSADDALDAVAGYSCFLDGSVRDFQRHTSQFTAGKNFDASGSWGPWIVTRDELPAPGDAAALALTTSVDGEVLQHASTSLLIHDVAAIVAYCSTFMALEPGDVIATGTPAGVGMARTPQRWLRPGETVEVTIEGIGTLRNPVVAEPVG